MRKSSTLALTGCLLMGVVASTGTAFAGSNSILLYPAAASGSNCAYGGYGRFVANGDSFETTDLCADGHSVTIYADVAPFRSDQNSYDFKYVNTKGSGNTYSVPHDITEGTDVSVKVCVTEGTVNLTCDGWATGTA